MVEVDQDLDQVVEDAEKADEHITKAEEHQKSGNKCMYWVFGILAVAIIIFLVIFFTHGI